MPSHSTPSIPRPCWHFTAYAGFTRLGTSAYTHGGLDRIMRESPRQQQRQGAPIR